MRGKHTGARAAISPLFQSEAATRFALCVFGKMMGKTIMMLT
ncbi:hypothetical protein CES85_5858 (plasmid) [Ochrobactrum quorumnocens]|uniref:Uncharacterized protein n=1 Tax=Ochrobactrum quorumnocens TaxID=271865 RepID=A0A248U9D6_9HYPH|nr:hypothetical protein CES85_5858 [[Ochrobactrum] quorumnocens]